MSREERRKGEVKARRRAPKEWRMGVCACVGVRVCQSVRARTPVAAGYPFWGGLGSRERISFPLVEPRLPKPHCGQVEAIL